MVVLLISYIKLQASDNKIKPCFPGSKTSVCDSDECCIGEGEFYKVGKRDVISKPSMPKLEKILFPWGNRAGKNIIPMATCAALAAFPSAAV